MREAPLLLRSADEACVGVALSSRSPFYILSTPLRYVSCSRRCHANTDALSTADGCMLTRRPCVCLTLGAFVCGSRERCSAAGFASATTPRAWYGRRQGGPRIHCEGHLSFQAYITIQEEHLVSQNEDVSGRPLLLTGCRHAAPQSSGAGSHNATSRCLFLPPHSPLFQAREALWP
jgi:hypothetical protein